MLYKYSGVKLCKLPIIVKSARFPENEPSADLCRRGRGGKSGTIAPDRKYRLFFGRSFANKVYLVGICPYLELNQLAFVNNFNICISFVVQEIG